MDTSYGWITCLFLGSSRHEIFGSVKKKRLETSLVSYQIYKYYVGVRGWRLGHREILSGFVLDDFVLQVWIRRFCGSCVEKKNAVVLRHLEIE